MVETALLKRPAWRQTLDPPSLVCGMTSTPTVFILLSFIGAKQRVHKLGSLLQRNEYGEEMSTTIKAATNIRKLRPTPLSD